MVNPRHQTPQGQSFAEHIWEAGFLSDPIYDHLQENVMENSGLCFNMFNLLKRQRSLDTFQKQLSKDDAIQRLFNYVLSIFSTLFWDRNHQRFAMKSFYCRFRRPEGQLSRNTSKDFLSSFWDTFPSFLSGKMSMVSANERRHHICNVLSHWLRPNSSALTL